MTPAFSTPTHPADTTAAQIASYLSIVFTFRAANDRSRGEVTHKVIIIKLRQQPR